MPLHTFPLRIYYEDTDAGGVVYHANYLKFAERARTDALRQAGFDQSLLLKERGIGFAVRRCEVDFLRPARLDDCLTIATQLPDISKVSMVMRQTIRRGDETLAVLRVTLACVNSQMKPARLPEDIRRSLITLLQ